MKTVLPTIATVIALVLVASGGAAVQQEPQTLDLDTDGVAESRATGETFDIELDVDGDILVTSSDVGVDRTAAGSGVTVTLTIGETTYEVLATVAGEGVSLVQTGVSADGWRLSAQGSTLGEGSQFRGSLILLGSDDGYVVSGEGVLTVQDGADTVSYGLTYAGEGTFA